MTAAGNLGDGLEDEALAAAPFATRLREVVRAAADRGEALPSEPALATSLGVSRPALREELARLESAGFIRRRRGAGTIANPGAFDLLARFDEQVEFADALREAGFEATVELLESSALALASSEAALLHVTAGSPALRTVKRWRADGRAVMLAIDLISVAPERAGALAGIDGSTGLFELVRSLRGEHVEWELAWPGAAAVPSPVGRWLELPTRAAVMTLDLVGVSSSGARAYCAIEYHVPGVVKAGFVRTVRA